MTIEKHLHEAHTALKTAAGQFRHYEALHAAKPDPIKAKVNENMAIMMEKGLKALEKVETIMRLTS